MAEMTPIRRVVTGQDGRGRSKVVWDGPAPAVHGTAVRDRGHTDLWVWREMPAPLSGEHDDGNLPDEFPSPPDGAHFRVVHWREKYDGAPTGMKPFHHPIERPDGRAWDRGGGNDVYRSAMHKTESVDYGILLRGERSVILDDAELLLKRGDVIVQVGAWHQWDSSRVGCLMAFNLISARFPDGPIGLVQRDLPVMRPSPARRLPDGIRPVRRVVTIDREPGRSSLVSDGASPDVRIDPARPGFALSRIWVTEGTPAPLATESLHLPHVLAPPARGSVCNVFTIPPDATWQGKVTSAEVKAYFHALACADASTYSPTAPHPYMQRMRTLDLCCVLEGEIDLVLDTGEVHLRAGETAVIRGSNHAWSNRASTAAVLAVISHDGRY